MAIILVADDEPEIVSLLARRLEARGHQVVPAADGRQAIMNAYAWKPELIISDIRMPFGYGTTAYETMQTEPRSAGIPVIFVTGVPLSTARRLVPDAPNVRLMAKPIDYPRLDGYIDELLEGVP